MWVWGLGYGVGWGVGRLFLGLRGFRVLDVYFLFSLCGFRMGLVFL